MEEKVTKSNLNKIVAKEIKELTEENREATVTRIKEYLVKLYGVDAPKNFFFVYGTLRKGQYNYNKLKALFGNESIESLYTTTADYAGLYDLGNYPVMLETRGSMKVTGEVIWCNDKVSKAIKDMEEEAGYTTSDVFLWLRDFGVKGEWKVISLVTYVAGKELQEKVEKNSNKYPRIYSGDWCKYLKAVEPEDSRIPEQKMADYYGYGECY